MTTFLRAWLASLKAGSACLGILTLVAAGPASAETCARCDQSLTLSAREWTCLVRRLPDLQKVATPVISFSLDNKVCDPVLGSRSTTPQIPEPVPAPARRAGASAAPAASHIYVVSQTQMGCLAKIAPHLPRGAPVEFNFGKRCASVASDK